FVRTDLGTRLEVPAHIGQVTATQRRTVLGRPPHHIGLVEHVLAALAGLRIDNCYLELNAPEPPGLDGSALGFVRALQGAGAVLQGGSRLAWSVDSPVLLEQNGATLTLHPAEEKELKVSYLLEYGPGSPIG